MPIKVDSEYKPGTDKPSAVTTWEQRIVGAASPEAAMIQLTYQQLVEARKLRMVVIGIAVMLFVCVVVGLVGTLMIVGALTPG